MAKFKPYVFPLLFLMVVGALTLALPKAVDWTRTFNHERSTPYGAKLWFDLLQNQYGAQNFKVVYKSIYELENETYHQEEVNQDWFIMAKNFAPDTEDIDALLSAVNKGARVVVAAENFGYEMEDTLGFGVSNALEPSLEFTYKINDSTNADTVYIAFLNKDLPQNPVFLHRFNIRRHFDDFDSSAFSVVAINHKGNACMLSYPIGRGQLILTTLPAAYTNLYMRKPSGLTYGMNTLAYLKGNQPMVFNGYYLLGRREQQTPLRYILSQAPLQWAYFLTIVLIFLLLVFGSRRRERPVPIVKPPPNYTMEFVGTVGNLYFEKGDHKDLLNKKITYWLEYVRHRYNMPTTQLNDAFIKRLAGKSGIDTGTLNRLVGKVRQALTSTNISAEALLELNNLIDNFYKIAK